MISLCWIWRILCWWHRHPYADTYLTGLDANGHDDKLNAAGPGKMRIQQLSEANNIIYSTIQPVSRWSLSPFMLGGNC